MHVNNAGAAAPPATTRTLSHVIDGNAQVVTGEADTLDVEVDVDVVVVVDVITLLLKSIPLTSPIFTFSTADLAFFKVGTS